MEDGHVGIQLLRRIHQPRQPAARAQDQLWQLCQRRALSRAVSTLVGRWYFQRGWYAHKQHDRGVDDVWYHQRKVAAHIFTTNNFQHYMTAVFLEMIERMTKVLDDAATSNTIINLSDLFY